MLRTNKSKLLVPVLILAGTWALAYAQQPTSSSQTSAAKFSKSYPLGVIPDSTPLYSELHQAYELTRSRKPEEGANRFRVALDKAIAAQDLPGQALAHAGLAHICYLKADYSVAQKESQQALEIFEKLENPVGVAIINSYLGNESWGLRDFPTARKYYRQALAGFDALGMLPEKARVLRSLELAHDPDSEKLLEEALVIARQLGNKELEAEVLQSVGDTFFAHGQFDAAQEQYEQAIDLLRQIGDQHDLAYVLTSEGRLQRAHGHPEKAIPLYQEALALQQKDGDRRGATQSTNAMAVAYEAMEDHVSAVQAFEKALAMARDVGSKSLIDFELGNLANAYNQVGRHQEAVNILQDLLSKEPEHADYRYEALSVAYRNLGRPQDALDAASKGLEIALREGNWDVQIQGHLRRAEAEEVLDQQEAALADAQQALRVIENLRAHLVPSDFMKRGFSEANQDSYGLYVRLLEHAGRPGPALEVAEEARSRAFLDLLASRERQTKVAQQNDGLQGHPQLVAKGSAETVLLRGGSSSREARAKTPPADVDIPSSAYAQPYSFAQVQATARRLNSTVLSYWVTPNSTYIWVVSGEGNPHTAEVHASWNDLEKIIARLAPGRSAQVKDDAVQPRFQVSEKSANSAGTRQLSARGGTTLIIASGQAQGWRELYRLLIAPVEEWLPKTPGSLLTIEPHGPLLMLPFAALTDSHGRYLLERFSLNYTPAVSLLQFTEEEKHQIQHLPSHYLLVADPAGMPAAPDRSLLPGLPGSRREVAAVASLLPAGKATVLQGRGADEDRVASLAAQNTVIHFATHGIIRDDEPFESYLALGANPGNPREDGRLTAEKIYGMALHADLVFLSACRSGQGKISGDGLVGLTRAFWYAGTPSVIASLWDVADEPTSRLVADFYRSRLQGNDKSRALRSAQLHLLRQLRAGQVTAHTAAGELRLPEDPLFWAGFVLQGEP